MRKLLIAAAGATAAMAVSAVPALACGGLVAPDGDVRLDKATTFVAWHDGVEHYVTSFAYSGSVADIGWIVPLPAVPSSIETAGRWTLQRLELEFAPRLDPTLLQAAGGARASASVVVEQVQVEALDVTVLKGSGAAVIDWCVHNGFLLPPETKNHLLRYAAESPVFMAAKYNSSIAQRRGLQSGDGVPLMLTMRTPRLWVPLEVLANDDTPVVADVFLLTDAPLRLNGEPSLLTGLVHGAPLKGAPGFTLAAQEPMNAALHHDLSSDRNMGWVPSSGWLTYLTLDASSDDVTYDLGVGSDSVIRLLSFGSTQVLPGSDPGISPLIPLTAVALLVAGGAAAYVGVRRVRLAMSTGWTPPAGSNPSTDPRK